MWIGCACAGDTIKTHKYGLFKVAEDVMKHVLPKLSHPCSFLGVRSQTELNIAVEHIALNIGEVHVLGVASRESPKTNVCKFIPPKTLALRPVCEFRQCRRQDMYVAQVFILWGLYCTSIAGWPSKYKSSVYPYAFLASKPVFNNW